MYSCLKTVLMYSCLSHVLLYSCQKNSSHVLLSKKLYSRLKKVLMAKKETKNFILRVDADTMDAIEAWAADEFRSTNGQLQWIITEALRKAKRLPKKKGEKKEQL